LRKQVLAPSLSFLILISDIITKRIIEYFIQPHEIIQVLPFLRIVNVKNKGAAFGLFSSISNNIFIYVSLVAIFMIILYIIRTDNRIEVYALSLILGGAAGNLIDRATIGQVIDFIDVFVNNWHWPAFNVADAALSIGIVLFLFANIRHKR
jgi:signal peptidase II